MDKLAFTLKNVLVNLSNKWIDHLLKIDDYFVKQRKTIILIGVSLAYCKNDVHRLVDVRSQRLWSILTEMTEEFTQRGEISFSVEKVRIVEG